MLNKYKSFYLIGIGGISMGFLAEYLLKSGKKVSGSDLVPGDVTDKLIKMGIDVSFGHFPQNVQSYDAVVYTDAIGELDVELKTAKDNRIPCYSRMEVLSAIAEQHRNIITVAGSHGKTSTTSMIAHVLNADKRAFSAHIGGFDKTFSNCYLNGKDFFVTEACEYKKNFLKFKRVNVAVSLNVDNDHLECYSGFENLKKCFYEYADKAEISIINTDDKNLVAPFGGITFGSSQVADYGITDVENDHGKYAFTVREFGKELCRIKLNVYGRFQMYNALAATAACRQLGVSNESIIKGLATFNGVKRRFDELGSIGNVRFICDYAHHPTELRSILNLLTSIFDDEYYVVFQPHTYSRTRLLLEDFISVFEPLSNRLLIYKTYPAREEYNVLGSSEYLSAKIKNSHFTEDKGELKYVVQRELENNRCIVFLGAGDIYEVAKSVYIELKFNR